MFLASKTVLVNHHHKRSDGLDYGPGRSWPKSDGARSTSLLVVSIRDFAVLVLSIRSRSVLAIRFQEDEEANSSIREPSSRQISAARLSSRLAKFYHTIAILPGFLKFLPHFGITSHIQTFFSVLSERTLVRKSEDTFWQRKVSNRATCDSHGIIFLSLSSFVACIIIHQTVEKHATPRSRRQVAIVHLLHDINKPLPKAAFRVKAGLIDTAKGAATYLSRCAIHVRKYILRAIHVRK